MGNCGSYVRWDTRAFSLACPEGYENSNSMCYKPCTSLGVTGYKGNGPVCWKGSMSATRGVGKAMVAVCKNDRELVGGLCYKKCRQGYVPGVRAYRCVDETCA